MDFCQYCKSRHTWDCEDERETGRKRCSDFELDLNALDSEDRKAIQKLVIAHLMMKGD